MVVFDLWSVASHNSHDEKKIRGGLAAMNLTVFQILLSLKEGAKNASEMLAIIQGFDEGRRAPSLASFYRNLKRAVDERWVEIPLEAFPSKSRGRPGQMYRITEAGRSVTLDEAKRLRDLAAVALSADTRLNPESADA